MLKKVQLKLMFFATLNIHNFVFLFGHVIVTNINFTFTILLGNIVNINRRFTPSSVIELRS